MLLKPFGDSPPGTRRTHRQGMSAEYERAQIAERTRRGRWETARRGECMPWASECWIPVSAETAGLRGAGDAGALGG